MSVVERLGRVTHPTLGKCVRVKVRHWEGPTQPGRTGREVWTEVLVPSDQSKPQHKRHITAYTPDGRDRKYCISPSVSYFADLVKYASIRWGAKVAEALDS
jgi:hypothetical protein